MYYPSTTFYTRIETRYKNVFIFSSKCESIHVSHFSSPLLQIYCKILQISQKSRNNEEKKRNRKLHRSYPTFENNGESAKMSNGTERFFFFVSATQNCITGYTSAEKLLPRQRKSNMMEKNEGEERDENEIGRKILFSSLFSHFYPS